MDGNAEQKIKAYHILYEVKSQYSKDHEFLWRLAKATHLYAQIVGERSDQEQKKQLAYKANEYACAALELRSNSADVHKWCAVTLGSLSDYVGTQQKIKNGYQFKEHCEIALKLQPKDSLVLHLLGRWCYSVAMLTWFEKKVANTLLGAPIESSVAEARNYFLKAEEIQPESWKENLLYIAKCYAAEYDYKNAADWLEKAFNMPINDTDDEVAHNEIETLLSKYR
ncbi:PREDICTED: regulator of microtubule dynamics protein 1-like isoform X2 [Priapulus caudatus]|nr:PREDICTED: regulator of microtubule dynamics protein 1-like isoform X2 [Priapulus caudatus]